MVDRHQQWTPPVRRRWPLWLGLGAAVAVFLGLVPVLAARMLDSGTGPTLPAKPADFVASDILATPAGGRQLDSARARLTGPHFTVGFTSLEITTTAGIDYRAADGYELLRLSPVLATTASAPTEDVGAEVVVDGRAHRIDAGKVAAGGLTVSVRKGHTATLRITDEGRTQSLDLRTGERGRDAIPGYYPRVTLSWPDDDYHEIGKTTSGGCRRQTNLTALFFPTESAVEPWTPELGWAKPGRGWLAISYSSIVAPITVPADPRNIADLAACTDLLNFTWDLARSVAVRTADGEAAPTRVEDVGGHGAFVFDVPLSTRTATLLVHPAGTYDAGDGRPHPVEWSEPPPTARLAMASE
ncbi:hypothetical protein [Actinophytocola sp.]|uniref:hypothetical protein n=1 Tax=Actinophytocola sp. TaxID=1872138 RepID=UPI00389A2F48